MTSAAQPEPQRRRHGEPASRGRVLSERVARAAARTLLAANEKAGLESTAKTRELASRPRI